MTLQVICAPSLQLKEMSEIVDDIAEERKQIAEITEALTPKKGTPITEVAEPDSSQESDDDNQPSTTVNRKV